MSCEAVDRPDRGESVEATNDDPALMSTFANPRLPCMNAGGMGGGGEMAEHYEGVTVITHPLVQHKLTIMRDKETSTRGFRQLLREIAGLITYEATRDLPLETVPIETPLAPMDGKKIAGKKLVFASILRAGNGLLEGMLDLVPSARVAHVGIYRDHETLQPVEYYFKAPEDLGDRTVICVDPMLATANSSVAAVDKLKSRGAKDIRFVCLLAAPEGIKHFHDEHPDVPIYTAAIDCASERERLHRARPRRCRRPYVRDEVAAWRTHAREQLRAACAISSAPPSCLPAPSS